MKSQVLILDFGSQYTQLIARTVRELNVYCEILPGNSPAEKILERDPKVIILSGGPASVNAEHSPKCAAAVLEAGIPIFAICYGMQLVAVQFGGTVIGWERSALGTSVAEGVGAKSDESREFGPAEITITNNAGPFDSFKVGEKLTVWMSHGDKVEKLPSGMTSIATSPGSPVAAVFDPSRKIFASQFHPEVHHTPRGKEILKNFLFNVAQIKADWTSENFITETLEKISKTAPQGNVVCALSGGVDSTVAAVLVSKAIGKRLFCIFVDNGLLRENEAEQVMDSLTSLGLQVKLVSARERFLSELAGVTDPEQKRKIIGRVFIDLFEDEAHHIQDVEYLVQGTLYPDVIESVSVVGKSAVIKSHHNVGGLKENMKLKLIEPLRELFKDEVRAVGKKLNISDKLLQRQPFPGPGLAVRCLGDLTEERLAKLRKADLIISEELSKHDFVRDIWQSFAVLLPVRSVGVMGDGRTYDETIAVRAVTSRDGMTADWYYIPEEVLRKISSRIVNETPGVNRVVLDISSKPPATIEWE
jgi:GMP synthase (glutamine-hydrolysing)